VCLGFLISAFSVFDLFAENRKNVWVDHGRLAVLKIAFCKEEDEYSNAVIEPATLKYLTP
jgi:hypothetical protein